jgi:hypothetical protein
MMEDKVTAIDVFVNDPDDIGTIKEKLTVDAGRPVLITDWRNATSPSSRPSRSSATSCS